MFQAWLDIPNSTERSKQFGLSDDRFKVEEGFHLYEKPDRKILKFSKSCIYAVLTKDDLSQGKGKGQHHM